MSEQARMGDIRPRHGRVRDRGGNPAQRSGAAPVVSTGSRRAEYRAVGARGVVLQRSRDYPSDPVALWYGVTVLILAALSVGIAIGAAIWGG